uniref:Gypsy retrotransposon integrase-like protein 1 n=1 Tax=Naja naja TaxID=35670 RepID=A0A8C6XBR2_NAJNA
PQPLLEEKQEQQESSQESSGEEIWLDPRQQSRDKRLQRLKNSKKAREGEQNILFITPTNHLLTKMDLQQQRQLQADNQLLQQQVAQLTAQLAALNAPAVPPPRRKCLVAVPDKFSGQPEMFQAFQGQCQLFMAMRPEDFPDDRARVGFVISLLSGSAAQWAMPLLTQDSPLLMDYGVFCQHMRLMYEDPIRTQTAARQGIQAHALVDSGPTTNFMDQAFADHYGVPLEPVDPPLRVETIDGRELISGPIMTATQPLRLSIGVHEEVIRFYITADLHFPMVLGIAWLRTHDPRVTWSQNTISFPSLQCADHVRHTCASQDVSTPAISLPPDLKDFEDVFSEQEADWLPPHRPYDGPVDLLPNASLPFLDKNLARGFIRPSSSPLSAPVLFVKKKTGDLRLCCDYRRLNMITVQNCYPLPLIPELMERLREATIFTKLDLRGAYNLVQMREGDEWKTAFGTRYGHFEYTVMPFGLTNAPAVFQHLMNDVFRDMLNQFVVIYMDDILIYSRSRDSHLQHVRHVLQRLREHQLYAKLEKCLFFKTSIEFLGHFISPDDIAMDPRKVEAICNWEPPHWMKDVQRFMGFTNYYRSFIPDFASLTVPLTSLLQKKVPFQWGPLQQQAFERIKKAFVTEPVLRHADPGRPFVVETDTSDVAIRAVLLQASVDGGTPFPCAYFSRKLNSAKRNYTIWEKELLAMKVAFEAWRHHLEGARHYVEVRTDHRNLEHLTTARKLNQWQIRWLLFFARFNFRVNYIPSGLNQRVDALSRKPEYLRAKDSLPPRTVLPAPSLAAVQVPRKPEVGPASPWNIEEGLLKHRERLYVPTGPLRALIMSQCHDNPTAWHFGFYKTLHLVTRTFWWPRVRHDVHSYVTSCVPCRQAKTASGAPPGLFQPLPTPERPWGAISMDFLTDLPLSSGFTTVLVMVDTLTKTAHFIPCRGLPTARTTAHLFVQHIFQLHGLPDRVVSDRGVQFTAHFWKSLMATLDIKVCLSSTHHPETDRGTEKVIGVLEQYLRCFVNQQQSNWADYLFLAEFAFNNSQHTSTHITPFYTNLGYHPRFFPLTPSVLAELKAVQQLVR